MSSSNSSNPTNPTTTAPTTPTEFLNRAQVAFKHAKTLAGQAVETAGERGETQNRLLAVARTICGLLMLTTYINTAFIAAVLFATYPPVGHQISKMMDDMINGAFAGVPAWSRYVQVVMVLIVTVFAPDFPFLSLVGQVMAAKLSMELTYRNYCKEARIIFHQEVPAE